MLRIDGKINFIFFFSVFKWNQKTITLALLTSVSNERTANVKLFHVTFSVMCVKWNANTERDSPCSSCSIVRIGQIESIDWDKFHFSLNSVFFSFTLIPSFSPNNRTLFLFCHEYFCDNFFKQIFPRTMTILYEFFGCLSDEISWVCDYVLDEKYEKSFVKWKVFFIFVVECSGRLDRKNESEKLAVKTIAE